MVVNPLFGKVKSATFSDSTNSFGHVQIDTDPNHVVVGAMVDGGYINYPFKYSGNDAWFLHVMNIDLSVLTNTAVTGTYYYLEM